MTDVIIIGAGSAGCTAAKTLALNGYSVILLEKNKLPRYKSCSGQIIKKTADLVREYFGEDIPQSVTCAPALNKGMVFTNRFGKEFVFEQNGYNVWRSSFDMWLCEKAAACGAKILEEQTVVSCRDTDDYVDIEIAGKNRYKIKAGYVINCEGAVGAVKRKLLHKKDRSIITFQTFNKGSIDLDRHYFYAFLQPELSQYDAWLNVKDNNIVIGVAVKDQQNIDMYYNRFVDYLSEKYFLKLQQQLKTDKWLMPLVDNKHSIECGVGRVLFAGETAGFLNPMGEGISSAVESGYRAARAVMSCFETPDSVLAKYEESTQPLRDYMKRQWEFVSKLNGFF